MLSWCVMPQSVMAQVWVICAPAARHLGQPGRAIRKGGCLGALGYGPNVKRGLDGRTGRFAGSSSAGHVTGERCRRR